MHLQPNTILQGGKYRIHRFINSGGFGCTYEAEHTLLEKRVAIKEFFVKDFCNRDESTARISVATQGKQVLVNKLKRKFIEEAKALSHLHHASIISVSDVFEENGTAYYVMDYVDGSSLSDVLKREGALSEVRALGYIRQVADALAYVHKHNRLHLDIKPGNIMIDDNGRAILIDFGASKQYEEDGGENTSTIQGYTKGYAPPEQMTDDVVTFTPPTDIYALGTTLYKLLTDVTPPSATLRISGESLCELPASVSIATRDAIAAAMQLNRKDRPQSVDAFMVMLDAKVDEATVIEVNDNVEVNDNENKNKHENLEHPQGGYVDCPVGFWALVPVAAFGLAYLVELFYLPYLVYVFSTIAYIMSAGIVFLKMNMNINMLSRVFLVGWAGIMLFVSSKSYIEEMADSIPTFIAEILLLVFLAIRLIKTSAYKFPLMVGMVGTIFDFAHSLSFSILPSDIRQETLYAHAFLMSLSFLLMFFASRMLEKKRVGQC